MRKLIALLSVAVLTLIAGGTLAYFSDTETSENNVVQAGTIDILIADGYIYDWNTSVADGVFSYYGEIKPGYDAQQKNMRVFNLGSNEGSVLNISIDYRMYEDDDWNLSNGVNPGPESDTNWNDDQAAADDFASAIKILYLEVGYWENNNFIIGPSKTLVSNAQATFDGQLLGIQDFNANGYIDLYDLSQVTLSVDPPVIDGADSFLGDDYMKYSMTYTMDDDAGNDFQGDVLVFNVTVTLTQ